MSSMRSAVEIKTTETFRKLLLATKGNRVVICQGGTSSGKTYSNLQLLYNIAAVRPDNCVISVVSETYPHLKRGAMRDFFNILGPAYNESNHNKTDCIYKVGTSAIEFFSADVPSKVRGPRRNILFVNEANNISKETYDQLEIRTKDLVILDFNPVGHFWAHDLIGQPGVGFFVSTYRDNDMLDQSIVRSIEARRLTDPSWWHVYGEGQIGQVEGLVFQNGFEQIDTMPEISYRFGLDFGYTNDPTALVKVGITGDALYLDECMYDTGLTNDDLCNRMRGDVAQNSDCVWADCAEPKSIEEIRRRGYNIRPATKGKDSIMLGIDFIKRYKIKVTKRSVNLIKELRNYRWEKMTDGKFINKPIDTFNHAIDAIRYGISDRIQQGGYGMRIAI